MESPNFIIKTEGIVPMAQTTSSVQSSYGNNMTPLSCKKKLNFDTNKLKPQDYYRPSNTKRNERERKRVRTINDYFSKLQKFLPMTNKSVKKMSKVETLKAAIEFIEYLQNNRKRDHQASLVSSSSSDISCYSTPISPNTNCNQLDINATSTPIKTSPSTCEQFMLTSEYMSYHQTNNDYQNYMIQDNHHVYYSQYVTNQQQQQQPQQLEYYCDNNIYA